MNPPYSYRKEVYTGTPPPFNMVAMNLKPLEHMRTSTCICGITLIHHIFL